jgi:hypothetical protein
MTHGVLIPSAIAAMNVDAWNRAAIAAADDIDNGNFVALASKSVAAGYSEVWSATKPATTTPGLTGLWMVYSPEVVITVSGNSEYKGIDPDPRNFVNLHGLVMSVFKPSLGDLLLMSADCFSTSVAKGTNTFANATDTTGGYQLVWGASQTGSVTSLHLVATSYISIGSGVLGNTQRVTAYQMEVVGL